jgi:anaerobic selenocysteine-containing dehydrogenase
MTSQACSDDDVIRHLTAHSRDGSDALFAAGSAGLSPPPLYGWVREQALPDGRWRLTPPGMLERLTDLAGSLSTLGEGIPADTFLLVSGRQLSRTNSTDYVSREVSRDLPQISVNPEDAASRGLASGDCARVTSAFGILDADVRVDTRLRRGVISISHGWHQANVSRLTSSRERVDLLTAHPQMTALRVSLNKK